MKFEKAKPCETRLQGFAKGSQRGFTFAEVLAAMLILAILLPVVARGLLIGNRAALAAERKRVAVSLGNSLLTEMTLVNALGNAAESGSFEPEYPTYRWQLFREPWFDANVDQWTMVVTYAIQGQPTSITLTTLVDPDL